MTAYGNGVPPTLEYRIHYRSAILNAIVQGRIRQSEAREITAGQFRVQERRPDVPKVVPEPWVAFCKNVYELIHFEGMASLQFLNWVDACQEKLQ